MTPGTWEKAEIIQRSKETWENSTDPKMTAGTWEKVEIISEKQGNMGELKCQVNPRCQLEHGRKWGSY